MTYTLDVELFISEVKKYPEIWDHKSEGYKYKNRKQTAWDQIARVFLQDFDDMSTLEKADVFKKLHSKWRNIRDSFVRNNRKKDGKKNYLYATQLSFLSDLYMSKQSGSDEEWSDSEDSAAANLRKLGYKTKRLDLENWQSDDDAPIERLKTKKIKIENDALEYVDTLLPDPTTSYHHLAEDEDKSFFNSLLPAVRDFNLDQKLEFRSEVILLIKNIRNRQRNTLDPASGRFQ